MQAKLPADDFTPLKVVRTGTSAQPYALQSVHCKARCSVQQENSLQPRERPLTWCAIGQVARCAHRLGL